MLLIVSFSSQAQTSYSSISGLYNQAASTFGRSVPSVPTFGTKNETIGNQFLFENWVQGTVVDVNGNVFSSGYLFNFNKINQNLYFKLKDTAVAFLVSREEVKSIQLTDGFKNVLLEKVPAIDSNRFYQVLVKGEKYSLYSLTQTSFIAANFFTNGISSTGNMYDEFKDEVKYYVVTSDQKASEVPLKRKAVKKVFEAEKEKVTEFFREHDSAGNFGEGFLKSLVETLTH